MLTSNADEVDDFVELSRPVTRASQGIFKPNPKYALAVAAFDIMVPRSAKLELSIPEWKQAMDNKIEALR